MANDLPTHVTLTAATVATVTVNGNFSCLHLLNQTASTVVYARGDGTNPTVAGDQCWPVLPVAEGTCVSVAPAVDGTTSVKLISSGTPTVSVLPCGDCD